jgi:outer membrane protein TolC
MTSWLFARKVLRIAALLGATCAADLTAQVTEDRVARAPLTLHDVYATAREHNPRLMAARALTVALETRVSAASLLPDPALEFGVMNVSVPDLRADMATSMAPSIRLMQMVPFPGKLGLSGRIAQQSTAMARAAAEETWWQIRSEAAMAFYDVYEADRQIGVMRETLALLEEFATVARALYAAGEGRQSDVLRANVEVARMDAEIRRMTAMREGAAARLNGIMNRRAEQSVATPALPLLPATVPSLDTLRAWAALDRQMLAKGRAGLQQAGTVRALAQREVWPDFTVGVQYGQRPGERGTERMASAMIGFSVPVFASRRQLRMRDEAAAMEQMARAELADMEAGVDARLVELLAVLERDRTLVRLYRAEVLPQARANVESAFSSYRVGRVDFMTLVDARMTVNSFEQELHALVADYGRAIARIEMTVGRELPHSPSTLVEDR